MSAVYKIKVTKAKAEVELDFDNLPDNVFKAFLIKGAEHYVNLKMSKITVKDLEGEELAKAQAAALAQAKENVKACLDGTIRLAGVKATAAKGLSGKIKTEAMRIARGLVKDAMKAEGKKISHYKASQISKIAEDLIAQEPSIIEQAKANLEATAAKPLAISLANLQEDAELVKKDNEKKAKAKADKPLSAKQAGKVAPRKTKPAAQATA